MKLQAYAKLNLTLDIKSKREDGYHELDSIMQQISLYDEIEVTTRSEDNNFVDLKITNCRTIPTDKRNTCVRAAYAFLDRYKIINTGIYIKLKKNIPSGAGLGGGSSDAAAVLKALNEICKTNASIEDLEQIGLQIGADVPFFIRGGIQRMQGIGEKLKPLKYRFNEYFLVIKPECFANTKNIYKEFDSMDTKFLKDTTNDFIEACNHNDGSCFSHTSNHLSVVTYKDYPQVKSIVDAFDKMGFNACMTGSGTAVFSVFTSWFKANKALNYFRQMDGMFTKLCLTIND